MTADQKYAVAMAESGDLLREMHAQELSHDTVSAMMATIWLQRHNIPFVTTVHEAVAEAHAPIAQDPNAAISPRPSVE